MAFEGFTIKKSCPEVFTWRGVSYRKSTFTQQIVERLARDPEFTHIAKSTKKRKAASKEKSED